MNASRSRRRLVNLSVVVAFCFLQQSSAFGINLAAPFEKATNWLAVRSGLKPTGDNVNAVANQAAATGKEAEQAIEEIRPRATEALGSVTRTSEAATIILIWIKWPLVIAMYSLAFWLASLAIHGWQNFTKDVRRLLAAYSHLRNKRRDRIFPLALGSAVFFVTFYVLFLDGTEGFREGGCIVAYGLISTVSSFVVATFLSLLPVRRTRSCIFLGFVVCIVASFLLGSFIS